MEPDRERLRRLIEPVHDRAVAFARCLCKSRSDGDDLFQEAVLRAFTRLGDLRDDAAFRSWFYRVIVTVHRNRCRRAFWRRLIPFADATVVIDDGDDPGTSGDYRISDWSPDAARATQRARAALARLPAVQREAVVLYEIEGWQVEEIASLHRVSVSAIKSRLVRARARMRSFYDEPEGAKAPSLATGDVP